jgi:hypothetical protein
MKYRFSFIFTSLLFFFLVGLFLSTDSYAGTICFCHKFRQTNCTSDPGQQNGHTTHGDPAFGCDCGDGVCDPDEGEDELTCPQDCGSSPACENNQSDEGEACGEPQLPECPEGEDCVGCVCSPPILCVSDSECPDDGNPCNGAELCVPVLGCVSDEIIPAGAACGVNAVSGSGSCSLSALPLSGGSGHLGMIWTAGGLLIAFLWRGLRSGR